MYKNISNDNQKMYKITKSGEHVFYFENKVGNISFDIACENAVVKIYGLYECKNSDNLILNITQKHSAPNTQSQVLIKSILKDTSKFNFKGLIHIPKDAINVTANLTNNNLLLSETTGVTTTPQLKVIPCQTKCTHTATITPLDLNQINYLATRGLTKNDAKKLLADGFKNEILKIKMYNL